MDALAKLDKATQMLAEARTLDDVKTIIDLAEAARTYARAAKLGTEAANHAAEIKLQAQYKAGEMLKSLERGTPGVKPELGDRMSRNSGSPYREVLQQEQIEPRAAQRWQQIAEIPKETFEAHIKEVKDNGGELTTAGVLRKARERNKEENPPKLPENKYRVVYADPPWKYGNTMPDYMGVQDDHYKLLTVQEIAALPIKQMVSSDAVLFLWVTSPILEESFQVVRGWGFEYKSSFIWDKVKHVMGHYNSVRHEILLVCTRGSCQPDVKKLFDSVYSEERTEHSVKPDFFRDMIDTIYPNGKRIELFSRRKSSGWDVWGNDVP